MNNQPEQMFKNAPIPENSGGTRDFQDLQPSDDEDTAQIIPLAMSAEQRELLTMRKQLAIILNNKVIGGFARQLIGVLGKGS